MESRAEWWDRTNDTARDLIEVVEGDLLARRVDRAWRLFLCAIARRVEPIMTAGEAVRLIDAAELLADGAGTAEGLVAAEYAFRRTDLHRGLPSSAADSAHWVAAWTACSPAYPAIFSITVLALESAAEASGDEEAEHRVQAGVFKCVFPNPFRPVAFDPAWRTSTAVGLAAAMYQVRDFGGMPVLADALEEAGCEIPDILAHCRGHGSHVRGCWVVDFVLGKSR